jgi:predicted DNA-binding WGR domain protein
MTATLYLRRADPARNMRRFYRLDIQPDLFGRILLMKQRGRIGARGRMLGEPYENEVLAAVALRVPPSGFSSRSRGAPALVRAKG